jgi:hypothetical protein
MEPRAAQKSTISAPGLLQTWNFHATMKHRLTGNRILVSWKNWNFLILNSHSESARSSNDQSWLVWLLSDIPQTLTFDSMFSVPTNCMFHTSYLVLRCMVRFSSSSSSSSTGAIASPRSPFIHTYLSTGSQISRTFLLQNIESYATILATSSLPPFIITPLSSCQTQAALQTTALLNLRLWQSAKA